MYKLPTQISAPSPFRRSLHQMPLAVTLLRITVHFPGWKIIPTPRQASGGRYDSIRNPSFSSLLHSGLPRAISWSAHTPVPSVIKRAESSARLAKMRSDATPPTFHVPHLTELVLCLGPRSVHGKLSSAGQRLVSFSACPPK